MNKFVSGILASTLLSMFIALPANAARTVVNVATGNVGGLWYLEGSQLGKMVANLDKDIEVTVFPAGGLTNIMRVESGDSQVGFAQGFNVAVAKLGQAPFKKPIENCRYLINLNEPAFCMITVTEKSGIKSIDEIIEKKLPVKVNINTIGGNNEFVFRLVMEQYGVTWADMRKWGAKLFPMTIAQSSNAMKDGQIDMDSWYASEDGSKYMEILASTKIRFLPVKKSVREALSKKYGLYDIIMPKGSYNGTVTEDMPLPGSASQLICNKDLPDDVAYKLVKAICENEKEWHSLTATAKAFKKEQAAEKGLIPLHPGAAKYYRERGWIK